MLQPLQEALNTANPGSRIELTGPLGIVFSHFWLVAIAIVALNVLIVNHRAQALVAAGRISSRERGLFAACLAGGLIALFGLYGLGQSLDHESSSLCLIAFPPTTLGGTIAWTATFAATTASLAWIWLGKGADLLTRIGPAYLRGPAVRHFEIPTVRLVTTAILVLGPLSNIVLQVLDPSLPRFCGH